MMSTSLYRFFVRNSSTKVNIYKMNFDRRTPVSYQESIKYMDSEAYKQTYESNLVWHLYRRNHKGGLPGKKTRYSCINKEGFVNTSYPCPICRDEYLVIHHENFKLLQQFINPYSGEIYDTKIHGLCEKQYIKLLIAIEQAKDFGYLNYELPERYFRYSEYSKK